MTTDTLPEYMLTPRMREMRDEMRRRARYNAALVRNLKTAALVALFIGLVLAAGALDHQWYMLTGELP